MPNTLDFKINNKIKTSNNDYFFVSWNENGIYNCTNLFEKFLGYSSTELNKLPFKHHSLIQSDVGKKFYEKVVNEIKNGNNLSEVLIYEFTNKYNKRYWLKEFIDITNVNGIINYESLIINITEFKETERELIERIYKKDELQKSKDKLLSIISHDLRAPFTSLLGFSDILLKEPDLPVEQRMEYLEYIHQAAELQLNLVNQLLDWGKLQAGSVKIDLRRLNIKDAIFNTIASLTGAAIRKNIKIKFEASKNFYVIADEHLLNQVVSNLISNAIKFTPTNKQITVILKLFSESMVEVIVKDEGIGISETNTNKLFNIESKFSTSGTAGEKGSGLGLLVVKEIIQKHSGNIWFYSKENEGSEFHFTLPKSEDIALIVESEKEKQFYFEKIFSKFLPSFKVVFAKNGFEAMQFSMDLTPAIVITYHNLKLMDGTQLVSSIRKRDPQNRIPIIIISDENIDLLKLKYKNLSIHNFIDYSSDIEIIIQQIANQLSNN